eukprot:846152-Alexandrium_andersonii.AAC.1
MSASLVGSEMCIRDSSRTTRTSRSTTSCPGLPWAFLRIANPFGRPSQSSTTTSARTACQWTQPSSR